MFGPSDDPRVTEAVLLLETEPQSVVLDAPRKPVHTQGIKTRLHHISDLADHALQAGGRQAALEDGQLYPLAVLFADARDPPQSAPALALRISDIVRNQYVHPGTGGQSVNCAHPAQLAFATSLRMRHSMTCGA